VWQKCSLQNRGVTDFNIKLPESATQQQVDMVKASYADRQAGPQNARKPFISTAEFQNLDRSAVEMDFVSSRQKTWTEIAAVFGTPLAVLGFTEDVNLANAETMRRLLWQDTIAPQIGLICRQLTGQLAVDFGPDWRIMPDFTGVQAMEEDFGERLDNAQKLWSMGVPFNEINQRLGLGFDPIEGGDIGYLSAGVLPVGYDPLDDAMTPDEPDTTKADAMLRALKAIGYGA
jgi:phage portal protein BeeE